MKLKDILGLGLLAVVLIIVGSVLISKFGGGGKKHTAQIEVVAPIDSTFNEQARTILLGQDKNYPAQTFISPPPLNNLNNVSPFRP